MKILVTSHGALCNGILESFEMIAGQLPNIISLSLSKDDTGQYKKELEDIIVTEKEDGLIILCDIIGGTPYNESYRHFLMYPDKVKVVSGLNLAMLMESGLALNNAVDLQELVDIAIDSGIQSITQAQPILEENQLDIEF
ncbi:PTS sugar transporter subunit IIA [Enterococcus gallinarum]|uniref:PTS sugar transporter subunit IIA n=1 Tax=Enterococcus gallinarum TaxID=1353 RepID=UPI0009C0A780|nr:PTS sugar transporter subunit IIA [Enterococcus gallinarum]OQO77323.1 hypothetical protein BH745_14690 [Enterococcus gallinarum]PCD91357.1 hypothetical protein CKY18_15770 [Enterococcus gallinarum]